MTGQSGRDVIGCQVEGAGASCEKEGAMPGGGGAWAESERGLGGEGRGLGGEMGLVWAWQSGTGGGWKAKP